MPRALLSLAALAVCSLAFPQYPGAEPVPDAVRPGFESITEADAREILNFLAGPKTSGRGTGQPGYQVAAEYVAEQFRRAGVKPFGENGTYFQNLKFYNSRAVPGSTVVRVAGSNVALSRDEAAFTSISSDVLLTGDVVLLAARGASAQLADPAKLAGKIVMVGGADLPRRVRRQVLTARPAALIRVSDAAFDGAGEISTQRVAVRATTPQLAVTREGAAKLLAAMGAEASVLAKSAPDGQTVVQPLGGALRLAGRFEQAEILVPNVVGVIEGSDERLKGEYVGVGAHLDHLGVQLGEVYPGADDDGSGSTALVQVARALAANPLKPRRSVVFMAFCGEEMGLLGSAHLVRNAPFPIDKMVAELQMDMVGRNSYGVQNGDPSRVDKESENTDTMRLVGAKRISTELDAIIQRLNRHVGFRFKYDAEDVYTRSDHYNFAARGIPIAFLFDGFTPDYHQPTDTIDKINWTKLTSAAKLFYLTALEVANRDLPLPKDVKADGG